MEKDNPHSNPHLKFMSMDEYMSHNEYTMESFKLKNDKLKSRLKNR